MADDDDDVTEAEGEGPVTRGEFNALAGTVGEIKNMLAAAIPGIHKASTAKVEARLDRPTTVEEQVQAELARADAERKAEERQAGIDSRLAALEAPKPPAEQPPAPPVPWRQRILGWG